MELEKPTHLNRVMTGSGESLYFSEEWNPHSSSVLSKKRSSEIFQDFQLTSWATDSDLSDSDNVSITTVMELNDSQSFACQVGPEDLADTVELCFREKSCDDFTTDGHLARGRHSNLPHHNLINSFLQKLCIFGLMNKLMLIFLEWLLLAVYP